MHRRPPPSAALNAHDSTHCPRSQPLAASSHGCSGRDQPASTGAPSLGIRLRASYPCPWAANGGRATTRVALACPSRCCQRAHRRVDGHGTQALARRRRGQLTHKSSSAQILARWTPASWTVDMRALSVSVLHTEASIVPVSSAQFEQVSFPRGFWRVGFVLRLRFHFFSLSARNINVREKIIKSKSGDGQCVS